MVAVIRRKSATRTRRTLRTIRLEDDAGAELASDEGRIVAGKIDEPILSGPALYPRKPVKAYVDRCATLQNSSATSMTRR
jgi:hypothetical protein